MRTFVLVHADESCLGNQRAGDSPGGAAALLEARTADGVARRDLFLSDPATTNNRMALGGAIEVFRQLSRKGASYRVAFVSDSQYLVKGVTEWRHGWKRRGWRRKGGEIENLELWQTLDRLLAAHRADFIWVRGHAGDAKNEYADHLAVEAATNLSNSDGLVASGIDAWLATEADAGRHEGFDPDDDFRKYEAKYGSG